MAARSLFAARALVALVTVGVASASCSLLVDSSGLAGDALLDAATSETVDAHDERASDVDATTGADAASGPRKNSCGALLFGTPIALSNGDFELGCANGWGTYQATVAEDTTTPSQGAIACRVCYTSGINGFFMSAAVNRPAVPGENYELVACVRALPGTSGDVFVHAELTATGDGITGTSVNAGATYVPVRVAWDVGSAHPSFGLDVRAPEVPGSCFLVDDVSLSIVRDAAAD